MLRRKFMQAVALSGVCAFKGIEAIAEAGARVTMVFEVKGFTCPTCAVGLDTLLGKEKGIISSHSTYPEGKATVTYNPGVTSDERIRAFIAAMGFSVTGAHAG